MLHRAWEYMSFLKACWYFLSCPSYVALFSQDVLLGMSSDSQRQLSNILWCTYLSGSTLKYLGGF